MSDLWIVGVVVVALILCMGLGVTWQLTRSVGRLVARLAAEGWKEEQDVVRLLRRAIALVFCVGVLVSAVPWSLLVSTLGGMADQFFRNTVNQWMSGPDLFHSLAIDEADYRRLPINWRQAIAEIDLREGDDDEGLRQLISRLSIEDIEVLELTAQYALGGNLVDSTVPWELTSELLAHLEERGLALNTRIPLVHLSVGGTAATSPAEREVLFLAGHLYGLHLRAPEGAPNVNVSFFELTDLGRKMLQAARRPTDLVYLCRLQSHFQSRGLVAEIWPISAAGQKENQFQRISETTVLCGSAAVADNIDNDDPT